MNGKTINSLLLSLYRLCAFAGQREATCGIASRALPRGGVMTIQKTAGVKQIEVRAGKIWLTGASSGDVILSPGDRLELDGQWPYVIEGLTESKIILK